MEKKLRFLLIIFIGYFITNTLISCQSQEQKKNDAFESFREEKVMSEDSISIQKNVFNKEKELIPNKIDKHSLKKKIIPKVKVMDDWTKFKTETEKKLIENESKIKQVKGIPDISVKLLRKVVKEEKANNNLRNQLARFNYEDKEATEIFKSKMTRNLFEIDNKLTEISRN